MKQSVHAYPDYQQLSAAMAQDLVAELERKADGFWCLASGQSPRAAYRCLGSLLQQRGQQATRLRLCALDEWADLGANRQASCQSFIETHALEPWGVAAANAFFFRSDAPPSTELERFEQLLQQQGDFDLCVLGVGLNGHIGFNEPADALSLSLHAAQLSPASCKHDMVADLASKPRLGLSMGLGHIFRAKKIIVVVHSPAKLSIMQKIWNGSVSTQLPASLLHLHANVHWYLDDYLARSLALKP